MSLKQNDEYIENKREVLKMRLEILEETYLKERLTPEYGLKRIMEIEEELYQLNKLGVCA